MNMLQFPLFNVVYDVNGVTLTFKCAFCTLCTIHWGARETNPHAHSCNVRSNTMKMVFYFGNVCKSINKKRTFASIHSEVFLCGYSIIAMLS